MDYLVYSPSVSAYAATYGSDGTSTYYDLTDDITGCNISRNLSAASTFTLTLANPQRKYNGVFVPMDRVCIYASKSGTSQRLITGYITSVSAFTLYEQDFIIRGIDTLGILQRLYWDPDITASYQMVEQTYGGQVDAAGGYEMIRELLENVGGWKASRIHIQESIPPEVITWATKLYKAQKSDYADAEKIMSDIYSVVSSTGSTLTSSSSSSTDTSGGSGTASNATVEKAVEWAIAIANDGSNGYDQADRWGDHSFDCSSLVIRSCQAVGLDTGDASTTYDMKENFTANGWVWHSMGDTLERGDILLRILEHTAWYIGGNQICQASMNENGTVTGGEVGDQTGKEIKVCAYWDDDWDGFLRYGA